MKINCFKICLQLPNSKYSVKKARQFYFENVHNLTLNLFVTFDIVLYMSKIQFWCQMKRTLCGFPYPYFNAGFTTQDTYGICLNMGTLCRVSHIDCHCQYQSMEILINSLHPNSAIQLTLFLPYNVHRSTPPNL